jgi:hypothetical protein
MLTKTLGAILTEADSINSLMPQAKRLLELRHILREALPGELPRYCSVANWRRGRLVIFAENNAVAAKLKLLRPALGDHFQKRGVEVTAIEIQVQPAKASPAPPRKAAKLSAAGAESLAALSSQLSDSELKSLISALANRK